MNVQEVGAKLILGVYGTTLSISSQVESPRQGFSKAERKNFKKRLLELHTKANFINLIPKKQNFHENDSNLSLSTVLLSGVYIDKPVCIGNEVNPHFSSIRNTNQTALTKRMYQLS